MGAVPSWLVNIPKKAFLVTFRVDVNINNDKITRKITN